MAFDRDFNFEPDSGFPHLDLKTGEVIWIYDSEEEAAYAGIDETGNKQAREVIESAPDRYVVIPGRSHGEHHKILQQFLGSNWTDNENVRRFAKEAYFGSIGGWRKAVDDEEITRAFEGFRDRSLAKAADDFLHSHGIDPVWL